jgi:hypothetical protein
MVANWRPDRGAILVTVLTAALLVFLATRWPRPEPALGKIAFALSGFDEEGLYGPEDGRRARDYEFCVPDREATLAEVRAIDSSVRITRASGRIGCRTDEALAIGNTHQRDWRDVLTRLARLEYVRRIEPHYAE